MKKSFEKFYYKKDNQLHNLSDIQNEYERNDGDISKYQSNIFCPECKDAKLSFTHKTSRKRAFLSKLPSSEHTDDCSFKYYYTHNNEIKEFVKTLSKNQVDDKLESVLNRLTAKESKEDSTDNKESQSISFEKESERREGTKIRKVIHTKSINSDFPKAYENRMFVFYGKVKLISEKVNTGEGERFNLIVKIFQKKENNWIKKTSIFRNFKKDLIDENKTYCIAVLGHIKFYHGFPEIKTEDFDHIMFRELKNE